MERGEQIEVDDYEKIAALSQSTVGNNSEAEGKDGPPSTLQSWFKMKLDIPKVITELYPKIEDEDPNSNDYISDRPKLGTIELIGLKFELETKSKEEQTLMRVNVDGMSIHDPNVLQEVNMANLVSNSRPIFDDQNKPSEYVLKTKPHDVNRNKADHTHQEALRMSQRSSITQLTEEQERH